MQARRQLKGTNDCLGKYYKDHFGIFYDDPNAPVYPQTLSCPLQSWQEFVKESLGMALAACIEQIRGLTGKFECSVF